MSDDAVTDPASLEERRARREVRRARQREQSVLRTEKMHRARLAFEPEGISSSVYAPPAYQVGCSDWFKLVASAKRPQQFIAHARNAIEGAL